MFFRKKSEKRNPDDGINKQYTIGDVTATLSRTSNEALISFPKPQGEDASLVAEDYIATHCDDRVSISQTADNFVLEISFNNAGFLKLGEPSPPSMTIEAACENLAKLSAGQIAQEAAAIRKKSEERALQLNVANTDNQLTQMKRTAKPFVDATLKALTNQGFDVSSVDEARLLDDTAAIFVQGKMERGVR